VKNENIKTELNTKQPLDDHKNLYLKLRSRSEKLSRSINAYW